jgi:hypothetical protein
MFKYQVEGDPQLFNCDLRGSDEAIKLAIAYAYSHPVNVVIVDTDTGTTRPYYTVPVQPRKEPRPGWNDISKKDKK